METPSVTPSAEPPTTTATSAIAAPATPTSVQTATPTAESTVLPDEDEPTFTPTPEPTFTPPPPPPEVEGEHLWLQRPVPASGPAWTDKAYPYGSTRGGALPPHHGVEFGVPTGTPVLAVAPGAVRVAGDDSQIAYGPQTDFYGNLVIIELATESGDPVFALYGHLSEVAVTAGQSVAAGEIIGYSGATGVADGPHLHFEVRVGENSYGATRNPLLWLIPLPQTGVVAGRVVGPSGELLYEAPVTMQRVDAPSAYTATTSYAAGGPNGDSIQAENFALDDVTPGFYQAFVSVGDRRFSTDVWVYPGRTNWVEIVVAP
jgi:murein DD-endopeptidase MepM/ murein hydrolase activator NlpD